MAITDLGKLAGGNEKTSDTSLVVTFTVASQTLDRLFLCVAADNVTQTTPTISAVSDSRGNTWSAGANQAASIVTAAGAVVLSMWSCTVGTAHQVNDTLTITLTDAVTAKAGMVIGLRGADARAGTGGSAGTTGGPAQVVSAAPSATAVVGFVGFENNAAPGADTDTTNGSWSAMRSEFTTGAGAATNVALGSQVKIVTATGDQTWNPTGTADWAAMAYYVAVAAPSVEFGYVALEAPVVGDRATVEFGYVAFDAPVPVYAETLRATLFEAVGCTDSISVDHTFSGTSATITDPLGLTDAATQVTTFAPTVTDALGIIDMATASVDKIHADPVALSDTTAAEITKGHTDVLGAVDLTVSEATYVVTLTVTLGLTDQTSQVGTLADTRIDSVGLVDSASQMGSYERTNVDSLGFVDSISVEHVSGGQTVTDALVLTDVASVGVDKTHTDAVGLIDTVTQSVITEVADGVSLFDAQAMDLLLVHMRSGVLVSSF